MSYKDHVAKRNTAERITSSVTTIPSGAKRSLSLSTRRAEDPSPPRADSNVDNTAHSSPIEQASQPPEREQSNCTICLNTYEDRAVLESCHHEFCFSCIIQWSTLSHTCPLCIRPFTSCMHEIKNDQQYTIHQFEPLPLAQSSSGFPTAGGTSAPHGIIRRLYGPPQWRRRVRNRPPRTIPESADELSVSDRQQAALENRRNIYRNNLFVRHMGANKISGFQQITPESFRILPHRLDRLVPWIRRELQAVTTLSLTTPSSTSDTMTSHLGHENPNEEFDSGLEIIREYIIAVCKQYDLQTDQGQDLIRDFLHDHTEHFVHELMSFARSPFSIEAYDRVAQYGPSSSSSPSVSASAVAEREGDHRPVINSENQEDQRRRGHRRRHASPEYSDHVGSSGREERREGKRSRRNDIDRDARPYSPGEDTESTVQSQSTSRVRAVKRAISHDSSASSSRNEVGSSLKAVTRLTGETDKGKSSRGSIPGPSKTDLQAILLAKLKREQDLYHATRTSTNADPPPETKQ